MLKQESSAQMWLLQGAGNRVRGAEINRNCCMDKKRSLLLHAWELPICRTTLGSCDHSAFWKSLSCFWTAKPGGQIYCFCGFATTSATYSFSRSSLQRFREAESAVASHATRSKHEPRIRNALSVCHLTLLPDRISGFGHLWRCAWSLDVHVRRLSPGDSL